MLFKSFFRIVIENLYGRCVSQFRFFIVHKLIKKIINNQRNHYEEN